MNTIYTKANSLLFIQRLYADCQEPHRFISKLRCSLRNRVSKYKRRRENAVVVLFSNSFCNNHKTQVGFSNKPVDLSCSFYILIDK